MALHGEAEARGVEPAQAEEGGDAEAGAEEIEQQAAAPEAAGVDRHLHAGGAAEEGPGGGEFAGRDAQPEGGDGEVVAAQPEQGETEHHRHGNRQQRRRRQSDEQADEILVGCRG